MLSQDSRQSFIHNILILSISALIYIVPVVAAWCICTFYLSCNQGIFDDKQRSYFV